MIERNYILPDGMDFTSVPDPILGVVLDHVEDICVLKTLIRIVGLYYKKQGYPRFLTVQDIGGDYTISNTLKKYQRSTREDLVAILDEIVSIGVIVRVPVSIDEEPAYIYILNTKEGRRAVQLINDGAINFRDLDTIDSLIFAADGDKGTSVTSQNIFKLYEQNIGVITPIVSEELKDAETIYPDEWIAEAFRESALLNKRNWRYVEAILKRWKTEGKQDGKSRGDTKKNDSREWIRRYGLNKYPQ
mgnify:CR=1 FL=1